MHWKDVTSLQVLDSWVSSKISSGRRCLALVTYHFSKGDKHRGCAGHGYDTAAAREGACQLASQIEKVFGSNRSSVYPIVVGIETDEDSLIFHGENDKVRLACGVNHSGCSLICLRWGDD
jgi:hypothetical protein